ncbi:MAG: hypothetical protein HQL80_09380 [Magnetococcales bacterium]|nr:hypothetical protein [Magnetococcales bacterium]
MASAIARLLLIALLPLLATLLYWQGQHYDPMLLDFRAAAGNGRRVPLPERVDAWQRQPDARHFGKENLYEYINGHAEYFLSAGFRALTVVEYRLPTDGQQPSAVLDLYDMGEPLNAFGVLMDESSNGQSVPVGELGYQSQRSIGFTSGAYYVKLAAFADQLPLLPLAQAVDQGLRKAIPSTPGSAARNFLFPDLGVVTGTRFIKEDYHGWGFLQRVVERSFNRGDGTAITAFTVSGSAKQMAAMEQAFLAFFQQEGITVTEIRAEGMRLLQIADRYEGDWLLLPMESGWLGVFHPLDELLKGQLRAFVRHE